MTSDIAGRGLSPESRSVRRRLRGLLRHHPLQVVDCADPTVSSGDRLNVQPQLADLTKKENIPGLRWTEPAFVADEEEEIADEQEASCWGR